LNLLRRTGPSLAQTLQGLASLLHVGRFGHREGIKLIL
jgi:hypothetical protein